MEAQIAEMMGRDEKSNDYRFYHLFSSLVFRENLSFSFVGRKKRSFPVFRSKFHYFLSLRNTDSHRFFLYAGSQGAPPQIHLHLPCPYTVCVI